MALTPQDPHKAVITSVGSAIGGGTASSSKPVIAGTADAGTTVDIFDGVRMIGTAIVAADGTWSFTPTADLKAGSHSFTAISVDSNGDMGASSSPMSVKVPGGTPVAPVKPVIDGGGPTDDSGHPLPNPTTDPRPQMSGTGTPGDTITMYDGNTPIGSIVIDGTGQWHVKPQADLGPGTHDIYVIETSPAGVPSQPSDHYPVVIEPNIPATPAAPIMTDDSGAVIPAGSTTSDVHPHLTGTGHPGDIIKIYDGSSVIGSTVIAQDGTWKFTPPTDLPPGAHSITVTDTNAAGISSAHSDAISFMISGSFVPPGPITLAVAGTALLTDDHGNPIPSGNWTGDRLPHVSGTGTPGDTITVYNNLQGVGTVTVGTAIVDGQGHWSLTPSTNLPTGLNVIYVKESSALGTSGASVPVYIHVDPAVKQPMIASVWSNDGLQDISEMTAYGSTYSNSLHFNLTGLVPGQQYTLSGNAPGTAPTFIATALGTASVIVTRATGTFYYNLVDPNGHVVTSPITLTTGLILPDRPTLLSLTDENGMAYSVGSTTANYRPYIRGTGTAGDIIKVSDNGGVIGSTIVDSNGQWAYVTPTRLSDGTHVFTAQEVRAGVTSVSSDAASIVINTNIPAPPSAMTLTSDSGVAIPAGSTTGDSHPYITGSGKSGDLITVYDGSTVIGSTMVNNLGKWTFKPSSDMALGNHVISAIETNAAGSSSGQSNPINFVVGYVAPTVPSTPPTPTLTDDNGSKINGNWTGDTYPHVNGTGTPGNTITVYDLTAKGGAVTLGTTIIDLHGNWTFIPPSSLAAGGTQHSISVSESNAIGKSPITAGVPLYIDSAVGQPMLAGVWATNATNTMKPTDSIDIGEVAMNSTTLSHQLHFYFSGLVPGMQYSFSSFGTPSTFVASAKGCGDVYAIFAYDPVTVSFSLAESISGHVVVGNMSCTYGAYGYYGLSATADHSADAASVSATDEALQQGDHHTVVGEHDTFKGTSGHDIVDLNADPASYFKESTGHIEGSTAHPVDASGAQAVNTLHLTGDHQVLDLTSLTGKTAAAKISGIEVVDLGGQHNTLKLSLIDVLNLGETDLFQKDGKQQMMVQGKDGDTVDLSNTHIAGLADGEWAAHGTAQVGGVTYNVYEHSGAHTELLVQQGVQIVVH